MNLFAHPGRLWLLVAAVPMAAWVAWGARRRVREWSALGQSGRPPGDGSWAWLASMILVVLALGQPRWGRVFGPDVPAGHDLILVVDVSRSMAAEDAVPDRLGLAIEAGTSLLRALASGQGDRAGVVAFAGRGVVRCPLTAHLDSAVEVLRALRPGDVEPGGTDLGAAIDQAIGALDDEEHAEGRTLVVFSDGEDHVGSWPTLVDRLKEERIIVHAVAIGDPGRGHPISRFGPAGPGKVSDPEMVETRRSDVALGAVAKATGGVVVPLGLASVDLGALFRERIEPTAKRLRDESRLAERAERFPVFVLPAIGLGLTASWPGLARRRRRRLAFASLPLALLISGASPAGETAADLVARGRAAYASGRFADALDAFDRAIGLAPDAAVPRFDAASALFQLGRYPEALERYEESRDRGDDRLGVKVEYALGNTHLALGDVNEALARYDACLTSTLDGDGLDEVRSDAAANREFAAKRVKPPPESSEPSGADSPGSRKRPSSPRPSKAGRGDGDAPGAPDRQAPSAPGDPGPRGGSAPPSGTRGAGGAGGSGPSSPEPGSPEARLDAALENIREARRQRPPDPPPSGSKGVGKDW